MGDWGGKGGGEKEGRRGNGVGRRVDNRYCVLWPYFFFLLLRTYRRARRGTKEIKSVDVGAATCCNVRRNSQLRGRGRGRGGR